MSLTPQTITIDLNPSFSQMQTVHCSQYDDNIRQIEVKLKDGGTDIDVSSYTIYIEGTKPDKKGFSYPLNDIGSVDGNTVTFYVQLQMAAVPGMTRMEILLKDGDDHRIGSANFMLAVERAGLQDDTDVSDSELAPYISGAAQQAQAAANSAAAAAQSADDAEDAKDLAVAAKDTAVSVAASIPEDYTTLSNDVDDLKSAVNLLDDLLDVSETAVEVAGTEYQGFYLNETTQIKSIANNAFRIIKYPVSAGVKYNIHGTQCKLPLAVYPLAGFDTVDFTGTETVACDETIIPSGETNVAKNYDVDYVAPSDGFIYVWYSTTATANHLYVAEYVTESGRIKDKKALKIQLFGDSITDDVWGDQTTWATILQDYMSDYDLTIINSAVAGSAIGYRGKSSSGRYPDKTYNYVCDLMVDGTLDTTADVIVILIGTNNYGGSFPRIGALGDCGVINEDQSGIGFDVYGSAQFITNKVTTDTHALLLWVTPPQRYNSFDQSQPVNSLGEPLNNLNYTLRELSTAIADCANFNGVPCLNLTASLGWNKRNVANFTTDGLHPNAIGDKWLAQIISSEIKKHLHN